METLLEDQWSWVGGWGGAKKYLVGVDEEVRLPCLARFACARCAVGRLNRSAAEHDRKETFPRTPGEWILGLGQGDGLRADGR